MKFKNWVWSLPWEGMMTFFSNLRGQSKVYLLMYPFVKWIVIPTPQTDIRIK